MNYFASNKGRARKYISVLGATLGVLLFSVSLFSQANFGRILGIVTDQSGGVISGATVTIIDKDRGVARTLTTDDAGEYNAPTLIPGTYTVRVEAKGFQRLERQNVVLEVGKEVRVDLTPPPGEQRLTVTVTEQLPLVETTNATLGGTLNNADINDMPLNGRNYQSLLALRPGVMLQPGGGPWTQSTNGVRPDESAWMVDGVLNANFYDSRPLAGVPSPITDGATILPIDAIQEFNLEENPKAEYGWKPGAVVNVGIRSGTNTLHGSAYGFYRSAAWDARNYFNPGPTGGSCVLGALSLCDKTPTQLKQFGAVVGGPIKKDKLFFFGGYEGLRSYIGNAYVSDGIPETISQTTPSPANSLVDAIIAQQAAGVSPVSMALACPNLQAKALAGTVTTADVCTGGYWPNNAVQGSTSYISAFPNTNTSDNYVAKIDYHINSKNMLNGLLLLGRYYGDGEDRAFINAHDVNNFTIHTYTASGSWVWTPSSTVVNEVRFGYNRYTVETGVDAAGYTSPVNSGLGPLLPVINVGSFHQMGTWHNRPSKNSPNPYYDIQDSVSLLKGKHTFKFGGEYTHIEADANVPDYGRGQIGFDSLQTFIAGNPSSGTALLGNVNRRMLWKMFAGYVQDDYRINEKLTLNFGLRYELKTPIREANNRFANFDPTSPTGLVQQGTGGHSTLWKNYPYVFSPRFGFAYDVSGKGTTVVRGGFSVIYSSYSAVMWIQQNQFQNDKGVSLAVNPTGADLIAGGVKVFPGLAGGVNAQISTTTPTASQWNNVVFPPAPAGTNPIRCGDGLTIGGVTDPGPCDLMGVDPNLKTPYIVNYNFGVQHSFGNNFSLEVGYVGNHGGNLTGFVDVNQGALGTGVRPYAKQFPWFKYINYMTNDTRSNYNGLQTTLTKRMSHGLSFIAGYTYAHALDNGSLNRFAILPQNANNPGAEYGNSDFDVRNRFTFTTTYNIPGIKGFAQLLEGWQVNSIVTLQGAQPWTVNDYGKSANTPNFSGTGDRSDKWNISGSPQDDFTAGLYSLMYCTGPGNGGCSTTNSLTGGSYCGVNVLGAGPGGACDAGASAALWAKCTAGAADPTGTLLSPQGGCFVSRTGNSVLTPPAPGTFGNIGRNIFRDSGYKNVDFSVFKNFTFKERYSAQFRLEMFNLFNHPIWANPWGASNGTTNGNNAFTKPSAFGGTSGTPDTVAGSPIVSSGSARDVQVGLKLRF